MSQMNLMRSRWLKWAALVVPLVLLSAIAVSRRSTPVEVSEPASTLVSMHNIHVAALENIEVGPWVSGALKAAREAGVRAEIAGNVTEVLAEEGKFVRAGEILVRIEDPTAEAGVLAARSALRTAEENELTAHRNAERADTLLRVGGLPRRQAEAEQALHLNAEAQLEDARAGLVIAERRLEKTMVRAPFTGYVTVRAVNLGDVVQPGAPLFTVVDPKGMRLQAAVPAANLGEVRVGAEVRFRVVGYGDRTFVGVIEHINAVAEPSTRQVSIYVRIPNESGHLVAGLFAEGRVATQTRQAITIPTTALDESGASPQVVRLRNRVTERVDVVPGERDEQSDKIEIKEGLSAGDTILTGAARSLSAGTRVQINK